MSNHCYEVHGLVLDSCLLCPEFVPCNEIPKVHIRYGTVPDSLDNVISHGILYQASPDRFLYTFEGIAKYLVIEGKEIRIQRDPNASDDDVRLILYGPVFGALLFQQGLYPLHASAVEVNGKGVLFVGKSGVGKSTLAAAFYKRGYRILADDVCVTVISGKGIPMIHPGIQRLKLWNDTITKLGEDPNSFRKLRPLMEKYNFPLEQKLPEKEIPISHIYMISTTNLDEIQIQTMTNVEKITTLLNNTYRRYFLNGIGGHDKHFVHAAYLAKNIRMSQIIRPTRTFLLDELLKKIEEDLILLK